MPSPLIQFRALPPLDEKIRANTRYLNAEMDEKQQRTALSETARDHLTMFYELLTAELKTVRLSRDQALALCDTLHSTFVDSSWAGSAHRLLAHEVADAAEDGLSEKWGIDADDLAKTCASWTPGQGLAVVSAVMRFWAGPHEDYDAALHAAGLIRRPVDPLRPRAEGKTRA